MARSRGSWRPTTSARTWSSSAGRRPGPARRWSPRWSAGSSPAALGCRCPRWSPSTWLPASRSGSPTTRCRSCCRLSAGRNLGWTPARVRSDFEAARRRRRPRLAGRVLWFDALIGNVDRSWRNPNMLFWHGRLWLIDHGAAPDLPPPLARRRRGRCTALRRDGHALQRVRPETRRRRRRARPARHRGAAAEVLASSRTNGWTGSPASPPDALADSLRRPAAGAAGAREWLPGLVAAAPPGGRLRARAARTGRRGWGPPPPEGVTQDGGTTVVRVRRAAGRPRVERGEALNVGVVVYCRPATTSGAAPTWTPSGGALAPAASPRRAGAPSPSAADVCGAEPGAGPAGGRPRAAVPLAHRAQHVVQPGPVHAGLTGDPDAELDRLLACWCCRSSRDPRRPPHGASGTEWGGWTSSVGGDGMDHCAGAFSCNAASALLP